MSQARIIISVSEESYSHANGLAGIWTVPGKKPKEEFGILVVYPTPEIQDIGDQRRVVHWLKASPLAADIVGLRSDATAHTQGSRGGTQKWGVMLCEAEPDVPREWQDAKEQEIQFLNENPPDYKMKKDNKTGAIVAINVEPVEVTERKIELSNKVEAARAKFEKYCRTLVQSKEIALAKQSMATEDARLLAEGDTIWAGPEANRRNIDELHKRACRRLGQNRPWCYIAQQLVDCPGCGASIKENILSCPQCGGFLEDGIEELRAMKPKDRSMKMYPERYAEPMTPGGQRARA